MTVFFESNYGCQLCTSVLAFSYAILHIHLIAIVWKAWQAVCLLDWWSPKPAPRNPSVSVQSAKTEGHHWRSSRPHASCVQQHCRGNKTDELNCTVTGSWAAFWYFENVHIFSLQTNSQKQFTQGLCMEYQQTYHFTMQYIYCTFILNVCMYLI